MIKLQPKMFKESEKSTASEKLFINIIVFIVILAIITISEAIIPGIMANPEIQERYIRDGLITASGQIAPDTTTAQLMAISSEVTMQPKYFIPSLFCTCFGILFSIIYCRFIEARHLCSMGMRKKKAGIHYLQGILAGIAMMTVIVLISAIFGITKISLCSNINFGLIGLYLLGFLIQGASEEFIFRGYLMNTLGGRHSAAIAVGVSAAAFSLAHISNPGFGVLVFFNLLLFGIFASLYMICFDDIWGICAVHSIWNFTQGCFYGISVSGTGENESIFRTTAVSSSAILTGGDFGIEGSIITTFVLGIGIAAVLWIINKKQKTTSNITTNIPLG